MSRGVQNVRRAIKQRKKNRDYSLKQNSQKRLLPMIQEEEKHGFPMPEYNDSAFKIKEKRRIMPSHMTIKALISVILFAGLALLLTNNGQQLNGAKSWVSHQLQEEFPFAKMNEWYVTTFGSPISIAPQGDVSFDSDENSFILPVMGHVVETFSVNGTGIMISPPEKSLVTSMDRGVVIFVGNDKQTNKTIIVQHADGSNTTYGYLSSADVHLYQNIEANQAIGTFTPTGKNEVVYFSIEKDNKFIDPAQVIPVDDIP